MDLSRDCYYQIFEHLAKNYNHFESKVIVPLDDLVVHGLFGQKTRKQKLRVHAVQNVGLDFKENAELAARIYAAFEERKPGLNSGNPSHYISTLKQLALELYRGNPTIKRFSPKASKALEWMLLAYSLVIHPSSVVRLRIAKMGQDGSLGFAIYATRDIKCDDPIYELIGAVPGDSETPHSGLSVITPHPDHDLPDVAPRFFFGPARFINHLCQNFNAELGCRESTVAFYAYARRDIRAGEEITLDYGPNFFEDCPCSICKPLPLHSQVGNLTKRVATSEEEVELEKAKMRKLKRERQKRNRKKGHL